MCTAIVRPPAWQTVQKPATRELHAQQTSCQTGGALQPWTAERKAAENIPAKGDPAKAGGFPNRKAGQRPSWEEGHISKCRVETLCVLPEEARCACPSRVESVQPSGRESGMPSQTSDKCTYSEAVDRKAAQQFPSLQPASGSQCEVRLAAVLRQVYSQSPRCRTGRTATAESHAPPSKLSQTQGLLQSLREKSPNPRSCL
jgi:hypothetical protein